MHAKLVQLILRLSINILSLQDLRPMAGSFGESSISTLLAQPSPLFSEGRISG